LIGWRDRSYLQYTAPNASRGHLALDLLSNLFPEWNLPYASSHFPEQNFFPLHS